MEHVHCTPTLHILRMLNVFLSIKIVLLGKKVNIFIDICLLLRNECKLIHFISEKIESNCFSSMHMSVGARHAS